jgi:hypothetical protein
MSVGYHTRRGIQVPDYQCMRECIEGAASRCQQIPGAGVDKAIGQLLLDTPTPLTLEVALNVQTELENRADQADQLRRHQVDRARHRADLARRRYLAVDPDNRLVADLLAAGQCLDGGLKPADVDPAVPVSAPTPRTVRVRPVPNGRSTPVRRPGRERSLCIWSFGNHPQLAHES